MSAQRDAFDRAIAAWNAGDLDGYMELYDDGTALHGYTPEPMNKAEVGRYYGMFFAALSDLVIEVHEVVENGRLLACRCTVHGTHTAEFFGMAARGRRMHAPVITILRFEGDRVVEPHSVADFNNVVAQLTAD